MLTSSFFALHRFERPLINSDANEDFKHLTHPCSILWSLCLLCPTHAWATLSHWNNFRFISNPSYHCRYMIFQFASVMSKCACLYWVNSSYSASPACSLYLPNMLWRTLLALVGRSLSKILRLQLPFCTQMSLVCEYSATKRPTKNSAMYPSPW